MRDRSISFLYDEWHEWRGAVVDMPRKWYYRANLVLQGANQLPICSPVARFRVLAPRRRFIVKGVEHESRHK